MSPAEDVAPSARLDARYTFEEFVVGPHNRFPHAAAQAVADNLGKAYNPLFIYGPVGLGKTHLMHAVGHRVVQKNPKAQVLYVTAEQFMMEVIELLQSGNLRNFRDKYRTLDLLMVDDVQFLAASESTQEEFFHTFNQLHQVGKQIIMTSDRPPKMLTTLEDRLRSRFEWGLIADIKVPNLETRVAILRKKETMLGGMNLGEDMRLYIAGMLKSNVRELEGFLRRVQAYAQLNNQEITLPLVKEIMRELLPPRDWSEDDSSPTPPPLPTAPVRAEAVPEVQAEAFDVPPPPAAPAEEAVAVSLEPVDISFPASVSGAAPEPGFKSIPVAFFFPKGKEDSFKQVRQKFEDIIKKHKLKFQLEPAIQMAYAQDDSLSYDSFSAECAKMKLMIAIVLGPPPESRLQETIFQQKLQEVFDAQQLSLQMIPWEELNKDYRYLNLALDITLIRFKHKGR